MKLSNHVISQLVQYVVGDNYAPYRTATQLISLFNEFGGCDILPSNGLPMMPNSHLKYSRKTFVEQKMAEMNDTDGLHQLLETVINQSESPNAIQAIGDLLSRDGYSLIKDNEMYTISNGIIDKTTPVSNTTHFNNIEKQVLDALDKAKVSIRVAMAWFTNEKIKDKLIEKKNEGVDIDIIVYNDNVNQKHGVDLSEIPHTLIKGSRGGIMHNKFCVIDNQVVLQGSYNWTNSAETKNDESVTILKDPERATQFSVQFNKLKTNNINKK